MNRNRRSPIPPAPPPGETSGDCEIVEVIAGGLYGEWPPVRSRGKFNSDEPAVLVPPPADAAVTAPN